MRIRQLCEKIDRARTYDSIYKRFCGEKIGFGMYRDVYLLKDNPYWVLKFEKADSKRWCNIAEWLAYDQFRWYAKLAQYLAPNYFIEGSGRILIQRRVKHKDISEYPIRLPSIFTDLKRTNYGFIGEQFVCCDYPFLAWGGYNPFYMRKANWWDVEEITAEDIKTIEKREERKYG